jgi:ectoine hydroxylase
MREMTDEQRAEFDENGYLVVRNAIPADLVGRLREAMERVYADERAAGHLAKDGSMHTMGFLHRDPVFLELLDLPTTFPLVWGTLGWNIYAYHHHIDVHPPLPERRQKVWRWHQDGGRQNLEIETEPVRPMLSVRTAYFLSDVSQPGRGNLAVIPGSHKTSRLPRPEHPELGFDDPEGAVEVRANAGDCVFFDRRIYHGRTDNHSDITRRALFIGYTYRWIREHEDQLIPHDSELFRSLSPIRRQLLGAGKDALSFWGIGDTYPLREYLSAEGLLDPKVKNNR